MGKPLILLDRDGVLNRMVVDAEHGTIDSPLHPAQVELLPGVPEALARLTAAGFTLAIVSNQPAAAKNKTTRSNLEAVHEAVLTAACRVGGRIASSHICFHRAEDGCACRKPKPGMLLEAIERWLPGCGLRIADLVDCGLRIADCGFEEADITTHPPTSSLRTPQSAIRNGEIRNGEIRNGEIRNSWMVGDGITDIQAGAALGLRTGFLGPRKCDVCKVLHERELTPSWWGPDLPAFVDHLLNPCSSEGERQCL